MTPSRAVKLVAGRELREGLRNRTYVVTFAFSLVLVIGLAVVPLFVGGESQAQLAIVGDPIVEADELTERAELFDIDLAVRELEDLAEAEELLRDGELDVALVGDQELVVHEELDPTLRAMISDVVGQRAALTRLDELGLEPAEAAAVLEAGEGLSVRALEPPTEFTAFAFAFASTILLLMGVTFFASTVLMGVVEEKSSRVVEVVLGAMRPTQLLAGKLLGISTLAFTQVVILVLVGIGAVAITGSAELPEATGPIIAAVIGWFVLGFASYSVIYAAAGSLASRVEDAQSSIGPIGFVLFAAYFSTFLVVLPNPDGLASRLISMAPFLAPLTMPARVALGSATAIEMLIAVTLSLAAIAVAVMLAGRIYERSVLRTERVTWSAALRGGATKVS